MSLALRAAERGLVPDPLLRLGIRSLLRERLRQEVREVPDERQRARDLVLESMRSGPIALHANRANEQHYEVPADLYRLMLGPRLKYSSCLWPEGCTDLAHAEEAMLDLTCRRALLEDGMRILELGCGWGSLTLWMAERYPSASVTAVSNSASQRAFILERARQAGLGNVAVVTADMNDFRSRETFDRVVSVEMFEHMRNWERLLARVRRWLEPDGLLFLHVFSHRTTPYFFETEGEADWMARHFFTGGLMPSHDLLREFSSDLEVVRDWRVSGLHYEKTLRAWLRRLDCAADRAREILESRTAPDPARVRLQRWRMFLLACAELFAWNGGSEWHVSHYRLSPR